MKKKQAPQSWIMRYEMCININKMYGTYQKEYDGLEKIIKSLEKKYFDENQKYYKEFFNPKSKRDIIFFSPAFVQKVREYYTFLRQKPTEKGWIDIMKNIPVLYGGTGHFLRYAEKYLAEDEKLLRFYIYGTGNIVMLFHRKLIEKVENDMRKQNDFFLKSILNDTNVHEFEIFEQGSPKEYLFCINPVLMN